MRFALTRAGTLQRLLLAAALSSGCSGWVRLENVRDIPEGHALRMGTTKVISHIARCDADGFVVAPPGCRCGEPCVVDLRKNRFYVHDVTVDYGMLTVVGLLFGFAALGIYLFVIHQGDAH